MASRAATLGASATEAVLRGGCLDHPVLMQDLVEEHGKRFVLCNERNWDLVRFLVPTKPFEIRSASRSVARALFQMLADERDEQEQKLLDDLLRAEEDEVHVPSGDAPAESLYPEEDQVVIVSKRRKVRVGRVLRLQLPGTVMVPVSIRSPSHPDMQTVGLGSAQIEVMVQRGVCKGPQKPARVLFDERTLSDMLLLCMHLRESMSTASLPTLPLVKRKRAPLAPRGEHGVREYYDSARERWVSHKRLAPGSGPGSIKKVVCKGSGDLASAQLAAIPIQPEEE
jgi:hypothetical protein